MNLPPPSPDHQYWHCRSMEPEDCVHFLGHLTTDFGQIECWLCPVCGQVLLYDDLDGRMKKVRDRWGLLPGGP